MSPAAGRRVKNGRGPCGAQVCDRSDGTGQTAAAIGPGAAAAAAADRCSRMGKCVS